MILLCSSQQTLMSPVLHLTTWSCSAQQQRWIIVPVEERRGSHSSWHLVMLWQPLGLRTRQWAVVLKKKCCCLPVVALLITRPLNQNTGETDTDTTLWHVCSLQRENTNLSSADAMDDKRTGTAVFSNNVTFVAAVVGACEDMSIVMFVNLHVDGTANTHNRTHNGKFISLRQALPCW